MYVCRSMLTPLVSLSFYDACVSVYVKPFGIFNLSDACVSLYVNPFGIFKLFWCMCVALC